METKHLNGINGKPYYRYEGGYIIDKNDPIILDIKKGFENMASLGQKYRKEKK